MNNNQENTVNLNKESEHKSQISLKKAALVIGLVVMLLIAIAIFAISLLPKPEETVTEPTMADGRIQEEKLKKKRNEAERNLGMMEDRLLEDPEKKSNALARKVLDEFNRIYEDNKDKAEEQNGGGDSFEENVGKYGRFEDEVDRYGGLTGDRENIIRRNDRDLEKEKERKSMVVIEDKDQSEEAKNDNKRINETEEKHDYYKKLAESQGQGLKNPGITGDMNEQMGELLSYIETGKVPPRVELTERKNKSVTVCYNSQYPVVTLYEGEFLEGVILNEIKSDIQEGPVIALSSKDTFDDSGVYVIIPQGSKIIGRTQSINYRGQKRLYIWFDRMILPERKVGEQRASIEFPTRSIALDEHGINGLVSRVDRHFWLQYGSAILLGVLDGLVGMAQKSAGNESLSIMFDRSGQNFSRLNERRLLDYQNIMPTVMVKPGSRVKIYITSDINISAYDLKENRPYAKAKKGVYNE
jgi:type IV secretory pathway VirB10-like protein